ncbi:precorrin-2 C(20)-methyltransferase [Lusitaniella coriacea LEGE 07157]|uniref:Precorrin-2 C(20)-methyltransferase n=1 Tax=Lusitaniella coriacea LEGE 07157 TaxID=945747 RepID=A0A8J7JEA7_9CYAN|nr:precorrin-2 C(20)-methyltransferase [Lusitaniella coriacea]MBE9118750.1 precorrin-2 C(20)-methyltransferase [Lusitaniella coriacea LEGE 07157]
MHDNSQSKLAQIGTLYGISVGPGDPELVTLKGLRYLQRAKVVAFPAGIQGKPGIAQTIISPWLQPHQQQLSLHFPYVRDLETLTQAWNDAAQKVWNYLEQGQDVAFACEGDVSFYSTFTYLAQTLQHLHPDAIIETVPGVSSPMAAAAALELPLTARNQRLAVLPAIYTMGELESVLEWADVVVLMKVSSVYEQVWQVLQSYQLLDRSWIVERATLPQQKRYNLRDRPTLKLPYFSLLIVWVREPLE